MDKRVKLLREIIVERDLLLRCPKCCVVFTEVDGCNAVVCRRCGEPFCGICLFSNGTDAHSHLRIEHPGALFKTSSFERAHRARRAALVVAAVRSLSGEGPVLQKALVDELAKVDLPDLGIMAEDVLRDAQATIDVMLVEQSVSLLFLLAPSF